MKESDFGDEIRYFNMYTSIYMFGFYCDKNSMNEELVETITSQWALRDKYWKHRPWQIVDIVI